MRRLVMPRSPLPRPPRRAAPRNSLKPAEIARPRLCRHVTTNENNVGACIYERRRLYAPARRGVMHWAGDTEHGSTTRRNVATASCEYRVLGSPIVRTSHFRL